MIKFLYKITIRRNIFEARRKSCVVTMFKGKRDIQRHGSFRELKLMNHNVKIW